MTPSTRRSAAAYRPRSPTCADGETVLDLGSGAGADVLISARRVAPSGKAIGLDMTDEMLDLARRNAAEAGVENVEFVKGYLEDCRSPTTSVDVVISNCVINLSGDKPKVIAEAARVLRPGGRFAVSDVIADPDMDERTKADMGAWTGCIAGALTETEFRAALTGRRPRRDRDPTRPTASTNTPPPRSSAHASLTVIRARHRTGARHRTRARRRSSSGGPDQLKLTRPVPLTSCAELVGVAELLELHWPAFAPLEKRGSVKPTLTVM